jgi:hypothetical protein
VQEDTILALVFPFYDLDGSNDITQVSILNEPSNGETEVSISGNEIDFKYYPDGNYSGTDFVEIKIFDPNDLNASDTLSIPINILSVEDYPVFETQPKYTDAVIGYEWIYEFSAVDGDHNQTARILRPQIDSWVSFDLDSDENVSTGILSGTPNLTHLGDYELELVVEDDLGLLGYQVVQINVLGENSPPFINEGESLSIEMVEDSYWEKNNPLSSFDENKQRLTWSIHTEPEFGSISITSNEDDLTFMKYIPQKNYHGTDKVVIELSDGIDSDIFTYQFSILSVDDVPQFLSHNNGDQLTFEDGDQINEVVSFDDGDDDIIKYEIVQKPEWLAVNDDNFSVGELLLTGSPLVQNEGNSSVHIALVDSKNNRSEITIKVKVVVHNYPPSILFNDQNLAINEDSGSTLIGTLSVVDKDQTLGHEWIVIAGPQNGDLQIVQSGEDWTLSYTPDSNFYGTEQIHLRVDDSGTELGLPKNDELIFNIEINSIEDVPYFSSIPPKQVYEDEGLSYVVKVVDGDLPNDDLSITALSLPDWIDFSDFGDGNGLIVGNPKISDAGFHRVDLSVEDKNGSTAIQSFYLEVLVRDFPPVFKSVKTGTTLNKVTLYVKEDQELTEWVNPKGFIAVNPDPEIDDLTKISWYVGEDSQIGSKVEISGEGSRPSSFHYKPPSDFTGVDSFSLFMDEGDRRSELEFEIFVSEVYDPPYFETDLQKKYIVNEGELLDLEISAFDIDSNNLQFRLVGPSWEKDPWLKLIQGSAAKRANLRGTPKVGADGKIFPYTIFVIDDTGLAVNRSITFEVNGANSPPVILPNEIEILFNQKGEPLTRYDSITATDLEGDLLIWSFINAKDEEGNEMRLVNSNGSLPDIRFQPSSLRDNYGPFLLEVSDGLNQDSIAVRAKVDWDKNVTLSGFESLVVIKETQAFSQVLSLNADNFLATPTVGLINAPDWIQLKQIDETRFVIDGVSPLGSAGLYAINLEVLGDGLQSQGVSFDLEVIDPRIPSIELEGSLVNRISYFKPFVDPGYSSMDGRGVDLTEKVEVRESLIDSNGFQELTYFVSDEFQNEAFTKRLVRHYSESPLVLSTQHKKLFAEEVDLSWDENRNLSLIASSYKKLEVGGVEVSQQDLIKNAWISLPPDLTSDRLEVSIEGDEVKLSKIRSNREVTYILGKFLNNLTMDSKKVSSEFKYNLFLVAYTNDQVLKWIQTINSENPIENIGLSILPDNSCIVSGSFTESLNVRSSSITEELKATTESMFFCHYSKDGECVKKVNIALDDNTEVGKVISSDYPQRQIIELLDSSSEIPRSQFKILNGSFEEVDYLSLSSDEEVFINDALFVNENAVFAGGFKGSLFVNEKLLLHSNASAGFLICADLMGNILWAKMFHDDSGLLLPVKLTVDHWGDLIAGIEFTGTVESDLGSFSSVGENDILLMLLDSDDGSTLWQKPFGGTGNEHLHSLKVNSYGSPTIGLTTDVGFYADNLTFTPTAENEFHLVRLLPKTGLPSLEIDSLDLQVFGDFSVPLIGIHSEYLFFDLISAPPWVSLVEDDPSQGKGLLLGSIEHLAKSDLEQDLELTVGVFTMDGGFFEKTMPINFTFDEQAKEELGFLPVANEPFFPKTKGIREIVAVVNDPVSDWLILCRFDDYNTNQRSFLYKVLRLSEAYELTELTSISSANPVNISDLKIDSNGSIFIYGNFSTLLKIGSTNLTARGKSDLFLAEIDPQGQVIRRQRFGNENAEKAGQVLLSEGRVLISGSFENFLTIGSKQVSAVNSSIDGFVAELDRTNFYNVNWVKSFGSEGYDHSPSIIAFEDGQSVVSVIGEGNLEGANLSLDIVPKMFLQLDRLDQNGVSMGTVNFTSSGRINQAMVSPIPNINACVLALEFERDLLWSNGQITSRGGFDIFSTQINDFFNPEYNFSHIGGPWNDRLTDLEVVNANRYLICSKFYQSIQLGDRVIYSQGSSDGLVTKHGLGNHRLLDYYHLSSPGEDEVVSAISVSEKFLIVAGKTDNPQTRISHPFIQKLGDQPKQPMTLKNSNQLLKSSLPFEFTLQTDFWTNRNGDFELSNLEEEKIYHWLEIEVDGRGNLNFSGIAPSVEGIIPLDFNLTENVHEESLNIQFLLEIKIEDNYPPVLQIVDELNVTENQEFDLNFSFYDFEGSPVYLDWTGPNWVSIEKNGKDSALLSIHSTSKVGNYQVRIFASDYLGETSEYQIEIFVQQTEDETEKNGNDDGNETRSWIEKRIDLENGWSFHLDFGWVYLKEGPDGSTWLWKEGWGWLWSENKLWNDDGEGYFYKDASSSWIFWKPQESDVDNNVYDFEAEQWMKL